MRAADAIRLLPGVKRFADGSTLDCPIHDITIRRITDIRDFKLYDQPDLEMGRHKDASAGLGSLNNIRFEDLTFNRPGSIQVHATTDGLTLRNVALNFSATPDYHLLEISPKSQAYKFGTDDPARRTELFSPGLDRTVRNITVSGVRERDTKDDLSLERTVLLIHQKLNPDYPKTARKAALARPFRYGRDGNSSHIHDTPSMCSRVISDGKHHEGHHQRPPAVEFHLRVHIQTGSRGILGIVEDLYWCAHGTARHFLLGRSLAA